MCLFSANRKTRNKLLAFEYKQEASLFVTLSWLPTYSPSWSSSKSRIHSFCFLTFYYSHSADHCDQFCPPFISLSLEDTRALAHIQDYCQHVRFLLFSSCTKRLSFFPERFLNSPVHFISRRSCLYSRAFVTQTWGYHASITSALIRAATLVSEGGTADSNIVWRIAFWRKQLKRSSWYNVYHSSQCCSFYPISLQLTFFQFSLYEKWTFNFCFLLGF
jgi:hypothetical protein